LRISSSSVKRLWWRWGGRRLPTGSGAGVDSSTGGEKDNDNGSSSGSLGAFGLGLRARDTALVSLRTRPGGRGLRGVVGSRGDEGGRRENGLSGGSSREVIRCNDAELSPAFDKRDGPLGTDDARDSVGSVFVRPSRSRVCIWGACITGHSRPAEVLGTVSRRFSRRGSTDLANAD